MARSQDTVERIKQCLFINSDSLPVDLSQTEKDCKQRIEMAFAYCLEHPQNTDSDLVSYLKKKFNIEKSQAYYDINIAKQLLGNIKNAGKEWYRHVIVQSCLEAFKIAKVQKNPIAMAMAMDKIGKFTNCDVEDLEALPYERVFIPEWEPTADAKVLKLNTKNKDMDQVRKKLIRDLLDNSEEVEAL